MGPKSDDPGISFSSAGDDIAAITGDSGSSITSNGLPDIRKTCTYALRLMGEWSDSDIVLSALLAVLVTDGDQVVKERLATVRSFLEDQRSLLHSPTTCNTMIMATACIDAGVIVMGTTDALTTHVQPDDAVRRNRAAGVYNRRRHRRHQDDDPPPVITKRSRSCDDGTSTTTTNSRSSRQKICKCPYCYYTFSRPDALKRHSSFSCPFTATLKRGHQKQHQRGNYHRFRLH